MIHKITHVLHAVKQATDSCWDLQVGQLGGAEAVSKTPLSPIPHPKPAEEQPALQQLGSLARQRMQQQEPVEPCGDAVCCFGESAAAEGFLGRFPGTEVMPLIQRFVGL